MAHGILFASATRGHERAAIHVAEHPLGDDVQWVAGGELVFSKVCVNPLEVVTCAALLRADMEALGWVFTADTSTAH